MATFTPCVFEHHKREDGKFRISFRITHNRQSVYLKTDVFVSKQQLTRDFKLKDHYLIVRLSEKANEYQNKVVARFGTEQCCSAREIKEYLEFDVQLKGDDIDFVVFSRQYLENMKAEGRESTAKPIEKSLRALIDFWGREEIFFKEITLETLLRFGEYLKSKRKIVRKDRHAKDRTIECTPLDDYGVGKYYIDLRGLFYAGLSKYNDEATGYMLIKHNPFKRLEIKVKRITQKKNISIELIREISKMEDTNFARVNFARDVFMLSFLLVGMNMVDLYNVDEYKDGRISYRRQKTTLRRYDDAFMSIKIEPEMQPLIEKYRDKTGKRVFDFYKRYSSSHIFGSNVNKGLKTVAELCGIADNLTTYTARHSWATIARNKLRLSVDDIAQSLNHVDREHRTTFIYIEKDFSLIDEANRKMLDLLYESENH